MAISFSDVFREEGRKVDDGGIGSFVGHERYGRRSLRRDGRRHDLEEAIQRCFQSSETGTQISCVGVTKFCLGVRSREASVFEASKRSLAEARTSI